VAPLRERYATTHVLFANAIRSRPTVSYNRGQIIFSQGDCSDAVFSLARGQVKLTAVSERGKEAIVAISGPGDFIGEGCLGGQSRRATTAVAMLECEIVRLEKAEIRALFRDQPELLDWFVVRLLERNCRVEADLIDQRLNFSEKRLARLLLVLADKNEGHRPEFVLPEVNQTVLAEMVGTTRARVSFFMNKWRKMGLLDYDRHHVSVRSSPLRKVLLHEERAGPEEKTAAARGSVLA
jgi:CRP/FNR family transcriptional regulator, cyclic AMP receptor protein